MYLELKEMVERTIYTSRQIGYNIGFIAGCVGAFLGALVVFIPDDISVWQVLIGIIIMEICDHIGKRLIMKI